MNDSMKLAAMAKRDLENVGQNVWGAIALMACDFGGPLNITLHLQDPMVRIASEHLTPIVWRVDAKALET